MSKIAFFLSVTLMLLLSLYFVSLISIFNSPWGSTLILQFGMITAAFLLSFQGIFTLFWMLYAWEDPQKMKADAPSKTLSNPEKSFTLLIPARFESQVIGKTLESVANIMYPDALLEVIVLCKSDDFDTVAAAQTAISNLKKSNYKVLLFDSELNNKASALNAGLRAAQHEIVGVFDAEDEPKRHILNVVNTLFLTRDVAVVQGAVQLMNYQTRWYSALNVLEYYFWYKSALHLFSRLKIVPLGGNTVFIRKDVLLKHGGWRECLTEDAEIGLRLSLEQEKIQIMYHPALATGEESPASMSALLRQRTRWNQGFLQILLEGNWRNFKEIRRKFFALYLLSLAQINGINFILILFSLVTLFIELPIFATLMVLFPLYLLGLQLVTQMLGFNEFSKEYKIGWSFLPYLRIAFGFVPYQFLLTLSAARAMYRQFHKTENWEKTEHQNLHRAFV